MIKLEPQRSLLLDEAEGVAYIRSQDPPTSLNEVCSLTKQRKTSAHGDACQPGRLNEVCSLTKQRGYSWQTSFSVCRSLNEVCSLTKQRAFSVAGVMTV